MTADNKEAGALFEQLLEKIRANAPLIRCSGLVGSAKAYITARLIQEGPKRTYLVLAGNGREAATLQRDLEFFLGPTALGPLAKGEVCLFPPHDALPFSSLSSHPDLLCERAKTLWRLKQASPPSLIITTLTALLEPLPPQGVLSATTLAVGKEYPRDPFLKQLSEWGYQNATLVTELGNYAVRGSLVDLYCPLYEHPLRIEWPGDVIESIRLFDPKTQTTSGNTSGKTESAQIIPVREVLMTPQQRNHFGTTLRAHGEERDIPKPVWAPLIEKVKAGIPFPGIETYLPCFYETVTFLEDWLPQDSTLILPPLDSMTTPLLDHLHEIQLLRLQGALLSLDEVRRTLETLKKGLQSLPQIKWSKEVAPSEKDTFPFDVETHEDLRPSLEKARRTLHPLQPLIKRLEEWRLREQVYLVASTPAQAQRLSDLLEPFREQIIFENQLVTVPPSLETVPPSGKIKIVVGHLSAGFRFPGKINCITEEEIFGTKARRFERKKTSVFDLSSLSNLKIGDPVVHKGHGIALYQGLVHMKIEGVANDFVLLEFRGGDKLYLPVYRMNLITRYAGGNEAPRLDKLGGTSWETVKKKAQKAIQEMAGELLNLYAARSAGKGFTCLPPGEMFEAFEASFPFEETPDQERAIQEVLSDMQHEKPMDRLVLGDVGYGKTEVAMRAAFLAVSSGKQVAILVPTTLLAFQHFDRFMERFKDYPITIDMLSRFRSRPEQQETVKKTSAGGVDILIGTHRLLQPDVSFKNLGLLVIDEEHRFGVSHKEKIKRLRKNIDVLTLSATPIPRTLHMSLVGLRPISIIETPPSDRLSIRTYVLHFEEGVIREAILREIKRGGQVFFVHNQVESIEAMRQTLHDLLPEIRIDVGHGQMDEEDLENVMIRFSHHAFDLLLCTTIIESGIDISTANTIIINKAERMGLAQVYQLRGRVGRGGHRAYAYLIVSEEETLTPEAAQRLSVLQRFSELGSGFKLASYDLEIRGAGSLLGQKQSGQVAALGFELYTEILEETIRQMRGEKILASIDPEFHFKIPSYIPESYIDDPALRLELYRRLSLLENEEDVDAIADEITDRFGAFPPEVKNLLEVSSLKVHAKRLRIKQIRFDGKNFVYAFDIDSPLPPEMLLGRIKKEPKRYRMTPDSRLIVHGAPLSPFEALISSKKLLRELSLHVSPPS